MQKGRNMAGRKTTIASTGRKTTKKNVAANQTTFADYFRFGESYTSLVLGIIVVIIASLLVVTLLRNRNANSVSVTQDTSSIATQREESETINTDGEKTYVIQKGDDLWKIAEAQYNNGYSWTEIAKANNISNPSVINVGSKLVIPNIKKSADKTDIAAAAVEATVAPTAKATSTPTPSATLTPTPTKVAPTKMAAKPTPILPAAKVDPATKILGTSYTVVSGDYLWAIAERAYGDGYKWVEIARANKLPNPDLIYPGTKITLPR